MEENYDEIVCYCFRVKKSDILNEVKKGNRDLETVLENTGAGYGCGGCKTRIRKIIENN